MTGNPVYKPLFLQNVDDSSYSVSGAALLGISAVDPDNAMTFVKRLAPTAKGKLGDAIATVLVRNGSENDFDFLTDRYTSMAFGEEKLAATVAYCVYLSKLSDEQKIKTGIDKVIEFKNESPSAYLQYVEPTVKEALQIIANAKGAEMSIYISNALK
jgi:hypothetical protein